jgi:hypothetical protein
MYNFDFRPLIRLGAIVDNKKNFASDAFRKEVKSRLYEIAGKNKDWVLARHNPFGIKVGDVVILNKYNLFRSSGNGWDGGAKSLLNLIKGVEKNQVVYATVEDVSLATSLFTERIDYFVDAFNDNELNSFIENSLLEVKFMQWCKDRDGRNKVENHWRDDIGLYVDVTFKLHNITSICPKWGLNSYSFLPLDSPLGKKTEAYWKRENELQSKLDKIMADKKANEEKIKQLYIEVSNEPTRNL